MTMLAPLLTGLGLFFCGVAFIAANLTPLIGGPARRLLRRAMSADWRAGVTGAFAGFVTQSTNAVSLVVVGFVRAGIIPEERAVLLPTWSHVGAAALVIVVSLHTNVAVSYALAFAGAALYFNFKLSERVRHAVLVLLGAGMLFLGMEMLKVASGPLRTWLVDHGLLVGGRSNPALPLAIGLVMALVTQSSTVAGAIAVALVRVGVFDLDTALVLLTGANGGSALNYVVLGRKGEAVGRHILLFQAAQKLFGTLWLAILLIGFGSVAEAEARAITPDAAAQLAWLFLVAQVAGSLACTLARRPIAALFQRIAPPGRDDALAKPAFLLDEALSDARLALELATREEHRLLRRLPLMLDHVRETGNPDSPPPRQLAEAGLLVGEAVRRYLASLLDGEPGREAVVASMRLQRALDNTNALHQALEEFVRAARTADGTGGAATVGHMVESLHMLLEVLVEVVASDDPDDQAMSLALLGERDDVIEAIRGRLMAAATDAPAKVQEALFRTTFLFERILWLARDTAQVFTQSAQASGTSERSQAAPEAVTSSLSGLEAAEPS